MLMHQGIGLERFNTMSPGQARHALYECCCSVTWASVLVDRRPYASYAELFSAADSEMAELSDNDVDQALTGHAPICSRSNRSRSSLEQCGIDATSDEKTALTSACARYGEHFGFRLLLAPDGRSAAELTTEIDDRMHNDLDTERKVMRNELAKINHVRLGRMLGPEDGYPEF